MCPPHGNFHYLQPSFFGQEKQFRVKSPTFDPLQREDAIHSPPIEGFEPALRIFESQAKRQPKREIEDAPKQLPM
jgi:hypothetical protein